MVPLDKQESIAWEGEQVRQEAHDSTQAGPLVAERVRGSGGKGSLGIRVRKGGELSGCWAPHGPQVRTVGIGKQHESGEV